MNREDTLNEVLSIPNKNILLELCTGYGKSRIAIELIKKYRAKTILIVVPRNVLKQNWAEEIDKWWKNKPNNISIIYTTYVSLPKHAGTYDVIVFDESHHLSERCREALLNFTWKNSVLLSATVKENLKWDFSRLFENLYYYKITAKQAIENEVLPDPKVVCIKLVLDNQNSNKEYIINPKGTKIVRLPYARIWEAKTSKNKTIKYIISCTERQYYNEISSKVNWFKQQYMRSRRDVWRNKWLQACNERLKFLSDCKVPHILRISSRYRNKRTLTFCGSIEQTELLGHNCINSKNKESSEILRKFNEGKIKHITACNCLNEGVNLTNCEIGIYTNLNSSETIIQQRLGRLLRHPNPTIVLPYFVDTREEELAKKMLEDYNPDLITVTEYDIYN